MINGKIRVTSKGPELIVRYPNAPAVTCTWVLQLVDLERHGLSG